MTRRKRLTSHDAEDVLSGRAAGHERLARALDEIRDVHTDVHTGASAADTRATHLAAMASAYQPGSAVRPAPRRRRSGFVLRTSAAAAGALLVAGTALAATGTLPDAAQDAVANVVSSVGVNLPGGDDETRTTPAPAEAGKAGAERNKAEAEEFTTAKQDWTDCVASKAPDHEGPEPFDPEAACGPKPQRSPAPKDTDRPARTGPPTDRPSEDRPGRPMQTPERAEGRPDDAGRPESPGRSPERTPRP